MPNAQNFVAQPSAQPREITVIRLCDIVISLIALICLAPALVLLAILMRATSPGPILFSHRRMGFHGRSFHCLKFRSMFPDADRQLAALLATNAEAREEWARDHKLRNDPRITPIGRFLRKSSMDELPQLINVLRGEMSLVGPRPVTAEEALRYASRYWSYCTVKPGITGLWQISGRNDVSYGRRVALDTVFARRMSVKLYFSVLFGTPGALLGSHGAY